MQFLSNSVVWAARFSQMKRAKIINNPLPSKIKLVARSKLSTFVTARVTRKASLNTAAGKSSALPNLMLWT